MGWKTFGKVSLKDDGPFERNPHYVRLAYAGHPHKQTGLDNVKAQMRKGILEYCILAILSREDSYAPKIIAELKQAEMIVVEGTLYPILTRQKNAGLLTYRWEESPQGPPRKYYTLTEKGREYLTTLDEAWDELVGQIRIIRHGKQ